MPQTQSTFDSEYITATTTFRKTPRFTFPVSFYGMSVYRNYYMHFICVVLLVLAGPFLNGRNIALVAGDLSANSQGCVATYDPNTDYFPQKSTVVNATLFSITYQKNYKVLTNKMTNETFALYQCGTPSPSNLPLGTKFFSVPVKTVAVLDDTSSVAYLEMLGLRSSIVLLSSSDFVSSPCIQRLENASIASLSSSNKTLYAQQLTTVNLAIGAYTADNTTNNSVSVAAVDDPGTLQRVEWLKFYAAFFNFEEYAQQLVSQIDGNYACSKSLAQQAAPSNKPIVAWVTVEIPGQSGTNQSWSIADAPYKKELTEDAGAVYFNVTPLSYSTSDSFLKAIENVDIIIDETYLANTASDVLTNFGLNPSADNSMYKFIKNKKIFREDGLQSPSSGLDWYENAIPMQDAVLEDLMNAINPDLPTSNYQRIWLRNVLNNEQPKISSASNCTNTTAVLNDLATTCTTGNTPTTGSTNTNTKSGTTKPTATFFVPSLMIILVTCLFVRL